MSRPSSTGAGGLPKTAVVIPARNVAETIGHCIESVLAQDWPEAEMEVVVVDNGSTDDTVGIARRYPVKLAFERKRGRSAPRNRGVAEASKDATFIASVDADVEVPPDFLRNLIAALDRPWIGAAQAAVARIRRECREEPSPEYKLAHYYMPFLDTCAMVFRREAFDAAHGFDEELARSVDIDFSLRLLSCGYAFSWAPDVVVTKHHELSRRQAFQRGWEAGKSAFQLNTKWRQRIHRSTTGLAIDRVKGWVKPVLRDLSNRRSTLPTTSSEIAGRMVSYIYHRAAGAPTRRTDFLPATRLPAVLGPERYLLLVPDGSIVYDAPARRIVRLDANETALLEALLDGEGIAEGKEMLQRRGLR